MKSVSTALLGLASGFSVLTPAAWAELPHVKVALTGDQAAGFAPGTRYNRINRVFLNDAGLITLKAELTGTGITYDREPAIWAGHPGELQLVAHAGDPAPGLGGGIVYSGDEAYMQSNSPVTIDRYGKVTFADTVSGPGVDATTKYAMWVGKPGALQLIVRSGDRAPGTADGVVFKDGFSSKLNLAGDLWFNAHLSSPGWSQYHSGAWDASRGSPVLVAQTGQHAPGTPEGWVFDSMGMEALSPSGNVLLSSWLKPGEIWENGIWGDTPSSLQYVAMTGMPAAGTPPGVNYSGDVSYDGHTISFGSLDRAMNDSGQIVFMSLLRGDTVDRYNDSGVWAGSPGDMRLVARSGSQAPGLPPDTRFARMIQGDFPFPRTFQHERIAADGQVAFIAGLGGEGVGPENNDSIWLGPPDSIELAVREGDRAPDTPEGMVFRHGASGQTFLQLGMSPAGQIVFTAGLGGPGVDETNWLGVWATDPQGNLHLVARMGDSFDVGEGDSRTISQLWFDEFNTKGQLVVDLKFSDNSEGAFIFSVPEPSSLLACSASFALLALRRRRIPRATV